MRIKGATTAVAPARSRRGEPGEATLGYLLVAPAALVVLAVLGYPLLATVKASLFAEDLARGARDVFVGLGNYASLVGDRLFWVSINRTLYFTVVSIALELVVGFLVALLLNGRFAGRGLLRALVLIPWALPITVDGIMWKWILNGNYGALNALLTQIGWLDSYRAWLTNPFWAMHFVILADAWKVTPVVALLLLAGLQTIPGDVYEAAIVDGASGWKRAFSITLPLLAPTILVVVILRTLDAFRVFDLVYIMTQGGPASVTKVVSFYGYLELFRFLNFGRGAAVAALITVFIAAWSLLYSRLLPRASEVA